MVATGTSWHDDHFLMYHTPLLLNEQCAVYLAWFHFGFLGLHPGLRFFPGFFGAAAVSRWGYCMTGHPGHECSTSGCIREACHLVLQKKQKSRNQSWWFMIVACFGTTSIQLIFTKQQNSSTLNNFFKTTSSVHIWPPYEVSPGGGSKFCHRMADITEGRGADGIFQCWETRALLWD